MHPSHLEQVIIAVCKNETTEEAILKAFPNQIYDVKTTANTTYVVFAGSIISYELIPNKVFNFSGDYTFYSFA